MNKIYLIIFICLIIPSSNHIKHIDEHKFDYFVNNSQITDSDVYNYFPDNIISNIEISIDPITKNKHFILKQSYNDIEVFGRTSRIHLNKNKTALSFSSNFYDGEFDDSIPVLDKNDIYNIIDNNFIINNKVYKNDKIIYYIFNDYGYLCYQMDAITYSEAYRYIINAYTGEIIKKWTLIYDEGPTTGEGENLLGEWVDELHIYEGATFSPTGDLVTPYLVCEEYCFDYGDCGGSNQSGCEINPEQGNCPDNYLEDCNGECFHKWYLQFPGVGNGFCNDPWIDVDDESIGYGLYNMVDESNLVLGAIFTINSYGGFYEDLSYVNNQTNIFDSISPSLSHASGVSAHDYQRKTLDYFWSHHNYAGRDGNGKRTISIVNYGTGGGISQNNAFFNAGLDVLSYGIAGGAYRPFCAAQDIVAHEFTHGNTAHTSGLIYENEPGALNESLSDAFGYFVEAEHQNGGDWTEGEDIRINGGASRSFEDPPI